MALVVETGDGVAGAESYGSVADLQQYWADRPHSDFAATVAAASTTQLEGGLREASLYLDSVYSGRYRGIRRGWVQGLEWPRDGAYDDAGFRLPDLPPPLVTACYELAARAQTSPLASDADRSGAIKSERSKVGPLEEEIEYFDGASTLKRHGTVNHLLLPIIVPGAGWAWR